MAREIYLINGGISSTNLFYDGPKDEKRRVEYLDLSSMLKDIPHRLSNLDPKKKAVFHLEGYTPSQIKSIQTYIKEKFPKANFNAIEVTDEVQFFYSPNDGDKLYNVVELGEDETEASYDTLDSLIAGLESDVFNGEMPNRLSVLFEDMNESDSRKIKSYLSSKTKIVSGR